MKIKIKEYELDVEVTRKGCMTVRGSHAPYPHPWAGGDQQSYARISLGLAKGDTRVACHTCDNNRCVNPDHLYIGTASTNTHDDLTRGRRHLGQVFNYPEDYSETEHLRDFEDLF